jgi:hypothetical protein
MMKFISSKSLYMAISVFRSAGRNDPPPAVQPPGSECEIFSSARSAPCFAEPESAAAIVRFFRA